MYHVIVTEKYFLAETDDARNVVADYSGCINMRISDSGVISVDFYDGSNKVYRMQEGDELIKTPMEEQEVIDTPGLGEWYQDQVTKISQQEALELVTPDVAQLPH
jgi:hypothetical protein